MRIKSILFFLFIGIQAFGQDAPRDVVSLNGSWNFTADPDKKGVANGWASGLGEQAVEVEVPHTWNVMEGYEDYNGLAWYERKIDVPAHWKNKHVRLKFAAVYHDAVIYLNGKKAGEHLNSGYTTFYVDISRHLNYGEENTLVVSVDNDYSETMLPYKRVFDWANDGGIIRSVDLVVSDKPSIRYVHITPEIDFSDTSATAKLEIKLWQENVKKADFSISIKEKKSQKIVLSKDISLVKQGDVFNTSLKFDKVDLWHFNHPNLYQITVTAGNKNKVSDVKTEQFGFRKVELQGTQLLLNKEAVRLPGIEYMPSSHPDYGSAEPKWVMDSVVHMLKDLNTTITRFHWQVDEYMLDQFDEKGILVQAEIPWWQQPGKLGPEVMATAKQQLSEMIERDYNHPSIFAWGISNEVFSTDSEQFHVLKDYVKNLDNSRMANVVSNETYKRKENDESLIGDLPTWNDYVGTWYDEGKMERLPGYFDIFEGFLGDRPLLITESGLCEPRFSGGDLRRVNDMIYHYREWEKRDYIIGSIYFSLNDYRTQRGEDGAKNLKARIHGIVDLYLGKKPSYYVYKQLTAPVEILNVQKVNDTQVRVKLRNKNSLPSYTLREFKIIWKNTAGKPVERILPVLKPGDELTLELEDIQPRFAFEIIAPTGYHVTGYPVGVK